MELVRAVTRNLLPAMEEIPIQQPLLDGVEDIAFLFYDGTTWLDSWDATINRMPFRRPSKWPSLLRRRAGPHSIADHQFTWSFQLPRRRWTTNQVAATETAASTGAQGQNSGQRREVEGTPGAGQAEQCEHRRTAGPADGPRRFDGGGGQGRRWFGGGGGKAEERPEEAEDEDAGNHRR